MRIMPITSLESLSAAVEAAKNDPKSQWYVSRIAQARGWEDHIPSDWHTGERKVLTFREYPDDQREAVSDQLSAVAASVQSYAANDAEIDEVEDTIIAMTASAVNDFDSDYGEVFTAGLTASLETFVKYGLIDDNELTALTAAKKPRKVRTPAGVRRYGQPIGSIITSNGKVLKPGDKGYDAANKAFSGKAGSTEGEKAKMQSAGEGQRIKARLDGGSPKVPETKGKPSAEATERKKVSAERAKDKEAGPSKTRVSDPDKTTQTHEGVSKIIREAQESIKDADTRTIYAKQKELKRLKNQGEDGKYEVLDEKQQDSLNNAIQALDHAFDAAEMREDGDLKGARDEDKSAAKMFSRAHAALDTAPGVKPKSEQKSETKSESKPESKPDLKSRAKEAFDKPKSAGNATKSSSTNPTKNLKDMSDDELAKLLKDTKSLASDANAPDSQTSKALNEAFKIASEQKRRRSGGKGKSLADMQKADEANLPDTPVEYVSDKGFGIRRKGSPIDAHVRDNGMVDGEPSQNGPFRLSVKHTDDNRQLGPEQHFNNIDAARNALREAFDKADKVYGKKKKSAAPKTESKTTAEAKPKSTFKPTADGRTYLRDFDLDKLSDDELLIQSEASTRKYDEAAPGSYTRDVEGSNLRRLGDVINNRPTMNLDKVIAEGKARKARGETLLSPEDTLETKSVDDPAEQKADADTLRNLIGELGSATDFDSAQSAADRIRKIRSKYDSNKGDINQSVYYASMFADVASLSKKWSVSSGGTDADRARWKREANTNIAIAKDIAAHLPGAKPGAADKAIKWEQRGSGAGFKMSMNNSPIKGEVSKLHTGWMARIENDSTTAFSKSYKTQDQALAAARREFNKAQKSLGAGGTKNVDPADSSGKTVSQAIADSGKHNHKPSVLKPAQISHPGFVADKQRTLSDEVKGAKGADDQIPRSTFADGVTPSEGMSVVLNDGTKGTVTRLGQRYSKIKLDNGAHKFIVHHKINSADGDSKKPDASGVKTTDNAGDSMDQNLSKMSDQVLINLANSLQVDPSDPEWQKIYNALKRRGLTDKLDSKKA